MLEVSFVNGIAYHGVIHAFPGSSDVAALQDKGELKALITA